MTLRVWTDRSHRASETLEACSVCAHTRIGKFGAPLHALRVDKQRAIEVLNRYRKKLKYG